MPKEVIRDLQGFDVVVGWSNGHVQVATEMTAPNSSEAPKNLKELVKGWDGPDAESRGLYATFTPSNRAQINFLIRTLRKARDSAFGADE